MHELTGFALLEVDGQLIGRCSAASDRPQLELETLRQRLDAAGYGNWALQPPDGQVKFPHPWPPQIPPGRTVGL